MSIMGQLAALDRYNPDAAFPPNEVDAAEAARNAAAARMGRSIYRPPAMTDETINKISTGFLKAARGLTPYIEKMGAYGQTSVAEPGPMTEEEAFRVNQAQGKVGEAAGEYIRQNLIPRLPFGAISQAEARGGTLFANPRGRRRPMYTTEGEAPSMGGVADQARYGIGGNNPPAEYSYAQWAKELPKPAPVVRGTELPSIRGLPVEEAVAIARSQQHLIPAGGSSPGAFVGGPRDVKSMRGLHKQRQEFDEIIARNPEGGDWYDRYRAGQRLTTGNDPVQNLWQARQHGQWSAGVSPESELAFVLKENNASIAGMPTKAYLGRQHEGQLAAVAAKDPMKYPLADKTEEYARLVNPDQGIPGATGVNDFRYGWVHGLTNPQGGVIKDRGFTTAQHGYLDYETALAVDRANKAKLGGRSDWTGEQIQAAPWIIDKATDLQSRSPGMSWDEAMKQAAKTVVDFYPKHTYFATHEAQPGANVTGHMSRSVEATPAERAAFADDPRSTWATAPLGRDAIYAGLGIPGTGNYMRVLPTNPMTGYYTPPGGGVEANPGFVARPLGGMQSPAKDPKTQKVINKDDPFKTVPEAERTLLDAGEHVRALLDAQNAGAWHKHWLGGPNKQSNSLFFPREGPASVGELTAMRDVGARYGIGDIADTGQGITMTSFYPAPAGGKEFDKALRSGEFNQFGTPLRSRVDSGYAGYVGDDFNKYATPSSGEATKTMLEYVNKTPELREAFNKNPYIPERALARLERDEAWADRWGAPREDIQNLRKIIADSKGDWVDRVEAALKSGAILPATVAAFFAGAVGARQQYGGQNAL